MRCALPALAVAGLAHGPLVALAADDRGHPMITPYPGSRLANRQEPQFERYPLIVGLDKKGDFVSESLGGRLTRLYYNQPRDRSISRCRRTTRRRSPTPARRSCGRATARSAVPPTPRAPGTGSTASRPRRATRRATSRQSSPPATAWPTSPSPSGASATRSTSSSWPPWRPALEEIAKFLKAQEGAFFVVGHTDTTGALDHNLALSRARAAAVVDALGKGHGIAAGRLEAHGVGPLAPAAANDDDRGRGRNRRMVLVKR